MSDKVEPEKLAILRKNVMNWALTYDLTVPQNISALDQWLTFFKASDVEFAIQLKATIDARLGKKGAA